MADNIKYNRYMATPTPGVDVQTPVSKVRIFKTAAVLNLARAARITAGASLLVFLASTASVRAQAAPAAATPPAMAAPPFRIGRQVSATHAHAGSARLRD